MSKRTEPAFLKPRLRVTKASSIAIERNSSFVSFAIELNIVGQRALIHLTHRCNKTANIQIKIQHLR